jgi:hypothetical protein
MVTDKDWDFTTHSPAFAASFETQRAQRTAHAKRFLLPPANFLETGNWRDGIRLILQSPKNQAEVVKVFLCALCVSSEAGGKNKRPASP